MKNKLTLEVTGTVNEETKVGELVFDFYDENDDHVASILVDAKGVLSWAIWDERYKNKILNVASQINGSKVPDVLDNPMDTIVEKPERWSHAKDYIKQNGIEIKYGSDIEDEYNHNVTR